MDEITQTIQSMGQRARDASRETARANTDQKNQALLATAEALIAQRPPILAANQKDLPPGEAKGLDPAMLDRLALNEARFQAMLEGLQQVAALPDPIGEVNGLSYRPSGIQVGQMRVPLGVIGIIYESR
ncbi:MAG: gamma-glutamyl-phosphate reductase, partial [Gammaproteobacteria bacterium]|nr:gamma-glutamyl-phosphate reductase [Gammaproteobacteria bacterium]